MNQAYCGYDCSTCLGWIAYQIKDENEKKEYLLQYPSVIPCAGCHASENVCEKTCETCNMRICAIQKKINTCIDCADYPCVFHKKT